MCRTVLHLSTSKSSQETDPQIWLLRKLYKGISERCDLPHMGISLLEFMKLTELPGLLGERVFAAFDQDDDNLLDAYEFQEGFRQLFSGQKSEVSTLLFDMMDFGHKGFVTQADMRCLLYYLPARCAQCKAPVDYSWDLEAEICSCFADSAIISLELSEHLCDLHEQLFSDLLDAIITCLPTVFDDAYGFTQRKPCKNGRCASGTDTFSQTKPLKYNNRRYFFELKNECLYGYHGLEQSCAKKIVVLRGAFVIPVDEKGFQLKTSNVKYYFEANSTEDRDEWVERIQSTKGFRWFDDFYTVKENIGHGAYGQVLRVVSRSTHAEAAVKIVSKENISDQTEERLRREISILQHVSHPFCLKLLDVFETFERIYIVTELLSGGTLFEYLSDRKFIVEDVFTRKMTSDVATAVDYLHAHAIVHRDLKLENIMLRKSDLGELECVLIDFGLSCYLGPHQYTNEPVGTLKYAAPEVLSRQCYDCKSDCWSLGVIVYILLVGKMPFYGKSEREIAIRVLKGKVKIEQENVKREAADVVKGLLDRRSEQRWTVRAVLTSEWIAGSETTGSSDSGHSGNL